MKKRSYLVVLLLVFAGCVAPLPPGFRPVVDDSARVEAFGFSVQVPGKGWIQRRTDYGVIFGRRVDSIVSYHAGISVVRVASLSDKKSFLDFIKGKLMQGSDSFRYKVVRNDFKEEERDGLWLVVGRLDFDDSGAVNVGTNGSLATRTRTLFALDPNDRERLVTVWFSWRGLKFDENEFDAEASRFVRSLEKTRV